MSEFEVLVLSVIGLVLGIYIGYQWGYISAMRKRLGSTIGNPRPRCSYCGSADFSGICNSPDAPHRHHLYLLYPDG